MNKHTVIVIIASIVIAAPFVYSGLNIYAADQLQIRWAESKEFTYFEMSNDGSIKVCNPTPFFVSFNGFDIIPSYNDDIKGAFNIPAATLAPFSSSIFEGTFRSESRAESQYIFMHMDGEFAGTMPIRIDPTKMFVETNVQTSIIGIVSYPVSNYYTGFDFNDVMRGNLGEFDC